MRLSPIFGGMRLLARQGRYLVEPRTLTDEADEPFALPMLSLSRLIWMSTLARQFYDQHRRCLTLTLMLDLRERRWTTPWVPSQRCSPDGSAWSFRPQDFEGLPEETVIAGTFASTTARTIEELYALVPDFDGVHLLAGVGAAAEVLMGAVTLSLAPHVTEAHDLIEDDWAATLSANAARLRLD